MGRQVKFKAKGSHWKRHTAGKMNGLESKYADVLHRRKTAGEIVDFWFECFTLKLSEGTTYRPDFAILFPDGSMEFIDVKGGLVDPTSIVKAKVAAERFPQFTFVMESRKTKKDGGGWNRRLFGASENGSSDTPSLFGDNDDRVP